MKIWIEWESDDGQDQGSARWTSTDEQKVDSLLAVAVELLGETDTLA